MKLLRISGLVLLLFFCNNLVLSEIVKVGGYVFPPFLEKNAEQYTGVAIDLIKAMNEVQQQYEFRFVATSSKRRYLDFQGGRYDMILFEDKAWGWQGMPVAASNVFLKGGEVFIAKKQPNRTQNYFKSLNGKSISVLRGYHYGFANFNADEDYLKNNFNADVSNLPESNILKVVAGRVDLSVVTLAYLNKFLKENPKIKEYLLVSDSFDQDYKHTALLRDEGGPGLDEINRILETLKKTGVLAEVLGRYGIPHEYIVIDNAKH